MVLICDQNSSSYTYHSAVEIIVTADSDIPYFGTVQRVVFYLHSPDSKTAP